MFLYYLHLKFPERATKPFQLIDLKNWIFMAEHYGYLLQIN
jgi:hypothetical protein